MFTKSNVETVIQELSNQNRLFVSEADLQVSFIIEAEKKYGDRFYFYAEFSPSLNEIPDEYKHKFGDGVNFDLVIFDKANQDKTIIEFKYKTKELIDKVWTRDTNQVVVNKGGNDAPDLGRYDCWKDIYRTEQFKLNGYCTNGFFVFITGVYAYLSKPTEVLSEQFNMAPGHYNPENKEWADGANHISSFGVGRYHRLNIRNHYDLEYHQFINEFLTKKRTKNKFMYLILEI